MEENKKELVDFVVTARPYKTTLTKKYQARTEWVAPIVGEVKSVLPGTIISLHVAVGDRVEIGQLLLIHEAMKMQNRIISPVVGTVVRIAVAEGERIAKDHIMVVIE